LTLLSSTDDPSLRATTSLAPLSFNLVHVHDLDFRNQILLFFAFD